MEAADKPVLLDGTITALTVVTRHICYTDCHLLCDIMDETVIGSMVIPHYGRVKLSAVSNIAAMP